MRAASIITRRALVSSRGVRAAAPRQLAPWRCLTQTTAPVHNSLILGFSLPVTTRSPPARAIWACRRRPRAR